MHFVRSFSAIFVFLSIFAGQSLAADLACLITRNNTNPFFVEMREGAEAASTAAGMDFQAYAGVTDGDAAPQITAIENCVAAGAKGILITPSNDSVGSALIAAREAGILVIALDMPLADPAAQDMTFATDNFQAGLLIGQWAAATLGAEAANARIAMLNINADNISVDVQRDTGFLVGFGIEVPDLTVMGSETDARVIGHQTSQASVEGGVTAMENLLAIEPDINVVYTINELAAEGAYMALQNAGRTDVLIVSVDGGCPGVANVAAGVIDATVLQFPQGMAISGIEAIADFALNGTKPVECPKTSSFNPAGTEVPVCCKDPKTCIPGIQFQPLSLVTNNPVSGVNSIDTDQAMQLCWG